MLEIQNISKKFRINHEQQPYLSLRDAVVNFFSSPLGRSGGAEDFWALRDISFNVNAGDTLGIIGKNGAGKSTLLKILSKITPPTSGKIISRGRIASLLEVGTGFHPELSGRENVFMNGSILGMRRSEIQKNFDAIVDFAGVEKFIDTPLKHYSSGMQLRLAFAVAAFLENEILIIDEVLAVGDAEFQKKCMGKMEDVSKSGRTILFVSHNMGAISSLCKTSVMLKQGQIFFSGNTQNTIDVYLNEGANSEQYFGKTVKDIFVKSVKPVNSNREATNEFDTSKKITLLIEIEAKELNKNFQLGVAMLDSYKNKIFTNHYKTENNLRKNFTVSYEIPENTICAGRYSFDVALFIPNNTLFDYINDVCGITVLDSGTEMYQHENYGHVFIKCKWNELN
ncbi:MAG: ABC transporter ATP-binding protein [Bacteroidetes bacterium]|nr:ABC transporter ATP-binding protein [Bacteroidota bacterium]